MVVQGAFFTGDWVLGVASGVASTGAVLEVALCTPSTGVGIGFKGKATGTLGKTTRGFGRAAAGVSADGLEFASGGCAVASIERLESFVLTCSSTASFPTDGAAAGAAACLLACAGGGIAAFFAASLAACAALAAAAFVGAEVTGVTVTGKISVLSSRFFLGFGSGAVVHSCISICRPHIVSHSSSLTLLVLLHIEPSQ